MPIFIFFIFTLLVVVLIEPLNFQFIDEAFVVLALLYSLVNVCFRGTVRLVAWERKVATVSIVLIILGLYPHILSPQNVASAILMDLLIFNKFLLMYFAVRNISFKPSMVHWKKYLIPMMVLLVLVLGGLIFGNLFVPVFPVSDERYGMAAQQLFFGHPSRLAFFFAVAFFILLPFMFEHHKWFLYFVLVLGIFSLRMKYFVFVFIAALVLVRFGQIGLSKRTQIFFAVMAITGIGLGGGAVIQQILFHYSVESLDEGFSRASLFFGSMQIAIDNFPVGTGFGTFGSWASGVYYSPVYETYSLSKVHGLSADNFMFIADAYWAMVIGQFGVLGFFAVSYMYFVIGAGLYRHYKDEPTKSAQLFFISALLLISYLLIDSTSDSTFVQNRGVWAGAFLGLVMNSFRKSKHGMSR